MNTYFLSIVSLLVAFDPTVGHPSVFWTGPKYNPNFHTIPTSTIRGARLEPFIAQERLTSIFSKQNSQKKRLTYENQ